MADQTESGPGLAAGARIGPYRILGRLGAGGMGEVFRAVDTRLDRPVAIKIAAERFGQRFEHESRVISALNHPHICTLYDIGVLPSGAGYMVTELVEGETLQEWMRHAPPVERRLEVARQVLEALRAAHAAGIVHRDLKPANIMVRSDGYVKVLDFGLAKRVPIAAAPLDADTASLSLSVPGQVVGTAAYMSPEQIRGEDVDARTDLFAFGVILFEMLTGEHPWRRDTQIDTLHAILHEDSPSLGTEYDGLIQTLLRKNREERYGSASAVIAALSTPQAEQRGATRRATRLIVLPFRILRHHEASDFLAASLPDAITSSLGAIDSLVVRSTVVAARFADSAVPDIKKIAEEAQVDAILTGTLLSDGQRLQVNAQLVSVSDGALLWSNNSKMPLEDVFQLQDELVDRIVQSLALPLTSSEQRALKHDVPASAIAYELYLRANQQATSYGQSNMLLARDLYLRSIEEDPRYAPARACLGRAYRIIGKYDMGGLPENLSRAEETFQKAFALNPDLALAHNYYTYLQTDLGQPLQAVERLLKRARVHRNDPNIFAGLVHACRYAGLLEASVAAHHRAKEIDPLIPTTVPFSYVCLGDFPKALASCGHGGDHFVRYACLAASGKKREAREVLREIENFKDVVPQVRQWAVSWHAYLDGDLARSYELLDQALRMEGPMNRDPESGVWAAFDFANLGQSERALERISLALDLGCRCHHVILHHPWLEPVRSHSRFGELLERAAVLDREAQDVFQASGGPQLLGVQSRSLGVV